MEGRPVPELAQFVRDRYEAMNRAVAGKQDLASFVRESYDPEVVMEMGVLEGTIRGCDGVQKFIEEQAAIIAGLRSEPEEVIDAGDRMVVPFRLSGRARSTDLPFEVHYAHVLTLRDGKILRLELYTSKAKALAAAGVASN